MVARSSLGCLFQLMVLPEASAPARGPSSHQDRHLQHAPAPGSIVLSPPPFPRSETRRAPGAGHLPLLMMAPPQARGGWARCVPAEAGGVYGGVRLSPPAQLARLYCSWASQRTALAERIW